MKECLWKMLLLSVCEVMGIRYINIIQISLYLLFFKKLNLLNEKTEIMAVAVIIHSIHMIGTLMSRFRT